jgi:general secretion pathway protein M
LSKALALVLLAASSALLYAVLIEPLWTGYEEARQSRLQSAEHLAKYQRRGGAVEALKAELAAVQAAQASRAGYFPGENSSLAAAELQNLVKNTVRSAGGDLRSTQVLPVREEGGVTRVAIQVQLPIPIASLQALLHALESGRPFVFIDNVDVRRRQAGLRGRNYDEQIENVYVDVRFDIAGYMRSPGS